MKKQTILIMSLVISLGLLQFAFDEPISESLTSEGPNGPSKVPQPTASYTSHGAIEIAADDEFNETNGVTQDGESDGTLLNPYIIEGWNITTSGNYGIYIHDTTAHFIIRNCWISNHSSNHGIRIQSVAVGTVNITNNYFTNNHHGLYIYGADNSTISHNVVEDFSRGIRIRNSANSTLTNNTCNGGYFGIHLDSSDENVITNNTLNENYRNIYLEDNSNCNYIEDNLCNDGNEYGIYVDGERNTLIGNDVNGNKRDGICCKRQNNTLMDNMCKDNGEFGIRLSGAYAHALINNTLSNCGFGLMRLDTTDYANMIVEGNSVNDLPFGLFLNQPDLTLTTAYGQLYIINCSNVLVENQNLSNCSLGIHLLDSPNSTILNSVFTNLSDIGIYILTSDNCTIKNNVLSNIEGGGISLEESSYCMVEDNSLSDIDNYGVNAYDSAYCRVEENTLAYISDCGLYVEDSSYYVISNNAITNTTSSGIYYGESSNITTTNNVIANSSEKGIVIADGENHTLTGNLLLNNAEYGIFVDDSVNTTLHHNAFIGNYAGSYQACDAGEDNVWYDTVLNEGNYWSEYEGSGSYAINGSAGNTDPYPIGLSYDLTQPADILYECGTTRHTVDWTTLTSLPVTPLTPIEYIVYQNGTEVDSNFLTDDPSLSYNINGLAVGIYNFTIYTADQWNSDIDTVIVTVEDTSAPILDSPDDFEYQLGSTGHNVTWTATDASAETYILYRNGTQIATDSWTSTLEISINVDGLAVGSYNYSIVVMDLYDHATSDEVRVSVIDSTDPAINSPADVSYENGATDNSLSWTVTDAATGTYVIYQNGTQNATGTWTSGTAITIDIDGLEVGLHNYTIVVTDESGNSVSDTIMVTVTEKSGDDTKDSSTLVIVIVSIVVGGGAVGGVLFFLKKKGKL